MPSRSRATIPFVCGLNPTHGSLGFSSFTKPFTPEGILAPLAPLAPLVPLVLLLPLVLLTPKKEMDV